MLSDKTPCMFRTIDCEAPEHGLTPSRIVPFELNDNKVRDHKTLSKTNCETLWCDRDAFKLYYSSSDNDYKLLHYAIARPSCNIYIYSLASNSWTKITSANKGIPCDKCWMSPEFMDEWKPTVKLWRMDEDENWTPLGTYVPEEDLEKNTKEKLCSYTGANFDVHGDADPFDLEAKEKLKAAILELRLMEVIFGGTTEVPPLA
ncbi:hypothetical protein Tco_0901514 [Tanacetum coccineum]